MASLIFVEYTDTSLPCRFCVFIDVNMAYRNTTSAIVTTTTTTTEEPSRADEEKGNNICSPIVLIRSRHGTVL